MRDKRIVPASLLTSCYMKALFELNYCFTMTKEKQSVIVQFMMLTQNKCVTFYAVYCIDITDSYMYISIIMAQKSLGTEPWMVLFKWLHYKKHHQS